MLDLSVLLVGKRESGEAGKQTSTLRRTVERNMRPGLVSLDDEILGELEPYLDCGLPFSGNYQIRNHHLTVGARVAGAIAERYGDSGLSSGSVRLRFAGTAGQSFGAFLCPGVHLELEGEANDYVGKGLSGGEITIRPFRKAGYGDKSHLNLIMGNTVLYGATGGKLFAAGQAGDRFAVRNSGAVAVIEGAGNHCCEYMTGGIVAVLGRAGRNFAAGMSNGVAYVMDEAGTFGSRVNHDMVEVTDLDHVDSELLHRLVREHEEKTVSARARALLVHWNEYLPKFRKVVPRGAAAQVDGIRTAYLSSPARDEEAVLARRTA
jgi:glutamate synthase domain-containing protein 3